MDPRGNGDHLHVTKSLVVIDSVDSKLGIKSQYLTLALIFQNEGHFPSDVHLFMKDSL